LKNPDEIRDRIRGLLAHELELRLEETRKRLPHLCTHNHRQPTDSRKRVDGLANPAYNRIGPHGSTVGLCMLGAESPEDWQGTICEDPIDAQRCPYFNPVRSREAVSKEFLAQLQDPEWVVAEMPRVAELLWVLDAVQAIKIPFWKRWFLRLRRLSLEPVKPVVDPALLLDP
jgi:hypothetical protein